MASRLQDAIDPRPKRSTLGVVHTYRRRPASGPVPIVLEVLPRYFPITAEKTASDSEVFERTFMSCVRGRGDR